MLGDPDQVGEADLGVVVEAELGRLDRQLAGDPGRHDLVHRLDVVVGDLVGRGQVLEVLAEPRVHRADPRRLERQSRRQRVLERLARHESADGAAHEPESRQALLEPSIAGSPQEDAAHRDLRGDGPNGPLRMIGDGGLESHR